MLCVTLNSGGNNANAVAGRNSPAAVAVAPPPPPAVWERRPAAEAMLEDVGDPGSPEYVLASLDTSLPPTSSSMFHGERSLVLTTTGATAGAMDGSGLFDTPRQTVASPPPAPKRPPSSTSSITQPPPSTVAERAAIKAAEYAARREARAEQQALKEMQDATFKPRINSTRTTPPPFQQHNSSFNSSYSSSAAGTTPVKDSGSRLYDDAKERAARREARRLQLESDAPVECHPSQHHDPQHVDRLFEWEQQRRARLNEAARSAELATLATVTSQPAIDPVSRALAMSAASSASHRSSRTSSPAQHRATPPPPPAATPSSPAPVITSEQKAALVDRLYYQDAEVKRLERQLAEVRAAKDARRAHTPTITRQSTIIAGTSIPCSSSVYDRLTKEGVRADVRRSLREVETEVARREEANVGKYLGTMTHLLGTLAKQKRAAAAAVGTPPRDSKGAAADLPGTPPPSQAAKVDTRSFSPSINAKSRAIDTAKSDGSSGLRRVELLLEKGQRTEQHKERLRLQKQRDEEQRLEEERREAARLVAAAAKSHASKTGDAGASGAPGMRFEDRQRLWAANRELVIKRRQEEARALQDSVLQNECTFTPRTLTKKRNAAAAAAAGSLSTSMDMRQHSVSVGDDSDSAAGGRAPSPEARPPCVLLDLCTSP